MSQHRIVVLGASFGGLAAMYWLRRLHFRDELEVTVVAQRADAVYRPDLSLAPLSPPTFVRNLRVDVEARCRELGMRFLQDTALRIDAQAQRVDMLVHPPLSYDVLFWATGAEPAWDDVPGLGSHHVDIHDDYSAREVARQLRELSGGTLVLAAAKLRQDPDSTPQVATLTEFPLYEVAMLTAAQWKAQGRRQDLRIVLVTVAPNLGQGLGPKAQGLLDRRMRSLGVDVITGASIQGVEGSSLVLGGATRLQADQIVWTPPTNGSGLARHSGLDDGYGWVPTTEYMQHPRWPNIYALGDICARTQPKVGHAAMRQARTAVGHFWAQAARRPARPYVPKVLGTWHIGGGVGFGTFTDVPFGGTTEYVFVGRLAAWAKDIFGSTWRKGKGSLPIMP